MLLAYVLAGALGVSSASGFVPTGNLLTNPAAEAGGATRTGDVVVPIRGWTSSGTFTVVPYGATGPPRYFTFPPLFESWRIDGGRQFFSGGTAATSSAVQFVNVAAASRAIDSGAVRARLSGWIGGFAVEPDAGTVVASFLNASKRRLGQVRIGPVTPRERWNAILFVYRSRTARVPRGTREIRVAMATERISGDYADAYFDNLELRLTATVNTPAAGRRTGGVPR